MSNRPAQRQKAMLTLPKTILACLAAVAIAATSAAAEPATRTVDSPASLRQDLDALVAAGAPGAILFVRDGDHTTRLAAGLGDLARKTPMRAENHFKIASLTKTYTATVVLQLVGEGKLSLDDSVQQRLPGVVPNGSKITIRQLLNHTSGLSDFENDPRYLKPYLAGNFAHYWSPRQLVEFGVSHKPLFAPGTRLFVLEHELRRRSADRREGDRTNDRCRVRTQDLRASPPSPDELPDEARVCPARTRTATCCFGKPPLTDVTGLSPSLAPGSGGIVSTADDVADFYRALLSGRLLEPAQMPEMKTHRLRTHGQARHRRSRKGPRDRTDSRRAVPGATAVSCPAMTSSAF